MIHAKARKAQKVINAKAQRGQRRRGFKRRDAKDAETAKMVGMVILLRALGVLCGKKHPSPSGGVARGGG
ncbi:hypothetical protein A6A03_17625 [Chloroflexus islandicus]|uniref:Uncharacterized protein n=1 Tax=Chloroflexus islandicus TaxID=1707952 RepID=A0A178M728_9CHLR|nr:hypothetical protein A6A03_17625 [Chloroflexus islandicus]